MAIQLFNADDYRAANSDLASFSNEQALSHFQTFGLNEGRTFSALVNLDFYRSSNSDLSNFSNIQAFEHLQNNGVAEGRQFSEFVDLGFYRAANNDLQGLNNEQLLGHLQNNGVAEGRQFSEFVDLDFYQAANSDLQGLNNEQLLRHLELNGVGEGRQFSEFVDLDFYQAANSDLGGLNNQQLLGHLQTNGVAEGRRFSEFVDLDFYQATNSDLGSLNNEQLLGHLELNGIGEGRQFSQFFDINYYRSNNADLVAANLNSEELLEHFEINGLSEGRLFSVPFDVNYYRSVNSDLAAANLNNQQLYDHFQLNGLSERRVSSSSFNLPVYLANNPDLVAAGLDQKLAYDHFVISGQSEGRPGSDYAGNTLSTARNITIGSTANTFFDFVYSNNSPGAETNTTDPDDYYSFNLASVSNLNVSLNGLSGNADVRLIQDANSNGVLNSDDVIETSANSGATPESIVRNNLAAGNYFVQVFGGGVQSAFTHYNLSLSANAVTLNNDAPVAVDDTLVAADEDTVQTITTAGLISNDTDVDGDTLNFNGILTAPTNGTLVNNADGTLTYTPTANFNGTDSFTYEVADGNGGLDTATVNLTVNPLNDAPVAVDDTLVAADEDTVQTITTAGLIGNDTDVDGDTLNFNGILTAPTNGTLVNNADGTLTYTPTANFNGTDSFTYEVADGNGGLDTATVNLTVNPLNDAPVNTVPLASSTNEDTPLFFSTANNNLIAINDVDADNNPVEVTLSTTDGLLSLSGTTGLTFTIGDGTDDPTTTFSGTLSDINTALDGSSFSPTTNFSGAATLAISTNDQGSTGTGGPLTDTDTVNITVNAVNDAPVLDLSNSAGNDFTSSRPGTQNTVNAVSSTNLTVVDVDSANLNSATITLTNPATDDEILSADTGTTSITVSYDNVTDVLTLNGIAPLADYEAVLRTVKYQKTTTLAAGDTRTITFEINDGLTSNSPLVTSTLTFT